MKLRPQPGGSTEFSAVDSFRTTIPYSSPDFHFRAIRADEAGTLTYTSAAGQSRVAAFLAGETRFLCGNAVTAATGITNIELMY